MNKVLYDNNCSFCNRVKSILSKLDIFNYFTWTSNREYDFNKHNLEIDKDSIEKSIILITSSKQVYLEFYACRYIMIYIPVFWPILPLLFLPFISSFLGTIIYRQISKNRYCENQA